MANASNWLVQVPLADLLELQSSFERQRNLIEENAQLRREIEGLRRIQSDILLLLSDLRKAVSAF